MFDTIIKCDHPHCSCGLYEMEPRIFSDAWYARNRFLEIEREQAYYRGKLDGQRMYDRGYAPRDIMAIIP